MLLGIDVGGTHTDAVLIDDSGIRAAFKTPTRHDDLLGSIEDIVELACGETEPETIERLNLSTTLTTNAIVEGRTDDVGMLVCAGPGIAAENYQICKQFHLLEGSVDHRGSVVKSLNRKALGDAVRTCTQDGIKAFAVVSKFSPRNPDFEKTMAEAAQPHADVVTMGHSMTGRLNFPRRIATAYFNSAVWKLFNEFADAVEECLRRRGIRAPVNILKADGGTMPLAHARNVPVQSILSGPAASVMGIVAMCDVALDSIILDIGGTTTDIAIFAEGAPLMEMDGIAIGSHPTLVRALRTHSIGIGGDSALGMLGEEIHVGPHRKGPCLAHGGAHAALMDAFIYLGESEAGDVERSKRLFEDYAATLSIDAATLARRAVETAVTRIVAAVREMVNVINSKPVYTIHELLEDRRIVPKKVYLMGGPAQAFKMRLFKAFGLSVSVPGNYDVANAVGAALTRTTRNIELFADTERRRMYIPGLNFTKVIEASYSLEDAKRDAVRNLLQVLRSEGIPSRDENVEITHASSFAMVEGARRTGDNIRVKCQIRPGILHRYKNLLGQLC